MTMQQSLRNESRRRVLALPGVAAATMLCAMLFDIGAATAAEIKVLASANAAVRSALAELVPQFERQTGHKVSMEFASAAPMRRLTEAGEAFDILIAPGLIDDLVKHGKVATDTRAPFARTGLGYAVPKGASKPDISSADALKRALLNAKVVSYDPETEPGMQFADVLNRLGIAQDMRPRLKAQNQDDMLKAVERREVDIVVTSITNFLGRENLIDVVGAFPPEAQRYINQVIGVSATTKEPQAARALLQFLLSPAATSVLKAKGLERG
jgi:molybdate transport system substrate-binding protein